MWRPCSLDKLWSLTHAGRRELNWWAKRTSWRYVFWEQTQCRKTVFLIAQWTSTQYNRIESLASLAMIVRLRASREAIPYNASESSVGFIGVPLQCDSEERPGRACEFSQSRTKFSSVSESKEIFFRSRNWPSLEADVARSFQETSLRNFRGQSALIHGAHERTRDTDTSPEARRLVTLLF